MAPKFVPRQRKHKVLARQKKAGSGGAQEYENENENAEVILPEEKRAREERKKEMREALVEENRGKVSGKKKKRLDKYIVSLSTIPFLFWKFCTI